MWNNQKQQKQLFWKCVRKDRNIFANHMIDQQWHGARNYTLSSRTKRRWSSMVHTLIADDTAMQGVMTLTYLPWTKYPPFHRRYFQMYFIFVNEKFCILVEISFKFVPKGPINNIPLWVQIMAWCRTGNKPLSEPTMTHDADAYLRHSASMS